MKAFVKAIKTHPFTSIFYLFYLWLVVSEVCRTQNYLELEKTLKPGERLPHREWVGVLEFIVSVIFGLIMGANAIARYKDEMWFYLSMIVFIIVPLIIYV